MKTLFIVAIILTVAVLFILGIVSLATHNVKINSNPAETNKRRISKDVYAGLVGEDVAVYNFHQILRENEFVLSNLLIPTSNGRTTEIDSVLITRRGIFCIEVKKWIGHIFGFDESEYWYQVYDDRTIEKKKHPNPVIQNEKHCVNLERILKGKYYVDNIVIFIDEEDITNIESDHTFNIQGFYNYFKNLEDDVLSNEEIKQLHKLLARYKGTDEQLEKHKTSIQKRFKS